MVAFVVDWVVVVTWEQWEEEEAVDHPTNKCHEFLHNQVSVILSRHHPPVRYTPLCPPFVEERGVWYVVGERIVSTTTAIPQKTTIVASRIRNPSPNPRSQSHPRIVWECAHALQ